MQQLTDTTVPGMISETRLIATCGLTHEPVSYQPVSPVDAWARHACAASGFGEAIGITPCCHRMTTAYYAPTK